MDNTWSAGLYFKPFHHGVDVVVQSATKYFNGHADAMLGFVISNGKYDEMIRDTAYQFGNCVAPDICYLALRGSKTLHVRLPKHYENGLKLATWLKSRKEVEQVLHPALPSSPGHKFWQRDFTGASGLFSFVLKPVSMSALGSFINSLELFGIGDSWGGYESLISTAKIPGIRSVTRWPYQGPFVRIHAGLEASDDLICDLKYGFKQLTNES